MFKVAKSINNNKSKNRCFNRVFNKFSVYLKFYAAEVLDYQWFNWSKTCGIAEMTRDENFLLFFFGS